MPARARLKAPAGVLAGQAGTTTSSGGGSNNVLQLVQMEPLCVGRDNAAALLGIGTSTFEAHVSRGTLPKPRQIGGRAVWLVTELRAAALALPVSELLPPPAAEIQAKDAKAHADRMAKAPPGACPSCYGDGEQGGQFCGGFWKCESCGGTGKA